MSRGLLVLRHRLGRGLRAPARVSGGFAVLGGPVHIRGPRQARLAGTRPPRRTAAFWGVRGSSPGRNLANADVLSIASFCARLHSEKDIQDHKHHKDRIKRGSSLTWAFAAWIPAPHEKRYTAARKRACLPRSGQSAAPHQMRCSATRRFAVLMRNVGIGR